MKTEERNLVFNYLYYFHRQWWSKYLILIIILVIIFIYVVIIRQIKFQFRIFFMFWNVCLPLFYVSHITLSLIANLHCLSFILSHQHYHYHFFSKSQANKRRENIYFATKLLSLRNIWKLQRTENLLTYFSLKYL